MARYEEIIGGSWEQRSVFPESIPHLFHHDMAYLWVLEQQKDQRPRTWLTRVEAWKVLLRLFLLDQVTINAVDLLPPLKEVAERFGLHRVTWLRSQQTKQPIGVLSPTVIVRPLPDFSDSDVDRWRAEIKDNDKEFNHLVFVAIQDLRRYAGVSVFARRLADVLDREFTAVELTQRPPAGKKTAVPLLHRVTWEKRDGEGSPVVGIDLQIRAGTGRAIPESIPRCLACNTRLLYEESAPPIEVTGDPVRLTCVNPQCPSPAQTLSLDSFGIWLRSSGEAIRWTPDRVGQPMPDLRLPPEPHVAGNELTYEWNAAALGGEPFLRYLRLRFPDRQIHEVALGSIFFTRLVVPGQLVTFQGSAILPEWIGAIDTAQQASVRPSSEQKQIDFRDLKVYGWPVRFNHIYTEKSLVFEPEVSLGVFPDPSVVGPEWKWFRSFAEGAGSYKVHSSGQSLLQNLVSTETGLPRVVSLLSVKEPTTGVSYVPQRRERAETYGGTATASMAIDFGTTNTVIYYQPQSEGGEGYVARSETHGLRPREISTNVLWLAANPDWRNAEVIGGFLPGPRYRPSVVSDEYIVPSEMWRAGQGSYLLRWAGDHPDPEKKDSKPVWQFKWDRPDLGPEGYGPTRVAFLREVLLQFLPLVMRKFDPARVADLKLGISFPLAFEYQARGRYREMLETVKTEIERLSGVTVKSLFSINESKACVNAFGGFNDETFLVADMGGGTLDVALFSFLPDGTTDMHQMGSLRYAGERCVAALATQLTPSVDPMQLRDAIARNESHHKYGTQSAEKLVTRFATIAFEFLRTMVAAYRTKTKRSKEEIRVVLVGNGWHLVEAFSSDVAQRGERNVYLQVFGDMVRAVGDPNLTFYDKRPLTEFPSSKHLVVAGALQNVTSQNPVNELSEEQVAFAKLPAGRSFTLGGTPVPWSSLVGEGMDLPGGLDLDSASKEEIRVNIDQGPPDGSAAWMTRFSNSIGAPKGGSTPYPTEPELLRELRNSLGGSPAKMRRGPLQLILELEWSKALIKKKGSVL